MRPEFANALKKSIVFSCKINIHKFIILESRGKSAYLLKPSSKMKRKRSEMEEVKDEEHMLNQNKH
jgi:hypothetical protein